MKKFFTIFVVTLGVIFFILILVAVYCWIADPFNIKPLLSLEPPAVSEVEVSGDNVQSDKHPYLSPAQEKTLETFGIDPAALPTEITPAQESCFEAQLGSERVAEIKAGSVPKAGEMFKARECL